MSKFRVAAVYIAFGLIGVTAQEIANPLSEGELLQTLDSFGTGDPLDKEPLGVGGSKRATAKEKPSAKKEKGPTEITALEATFDQKTHQAVFIGQVVVKDPEFNVECDKLTAILKHESKEQVGNAEAPAPKPPIKAANPSPGTPAPRAEKAKDAKGGGLERAIAEAKAGSRVLVTQVKVEANGTTNSSVGRGDKVDYVAKTGDITLTGMPEVQQGINTCVATDASTVIILNREGRMRVVGPHKTVITDTSASNTR